MSRSFLFAAAASAVLTLSAPASAETVAVVNAHILSMGPAGDIASGAVVMRDGKIVAVGAGAAVPAGARVVDAKGQIVTPGFIAPSTNLMLSEVEAVKETRDDRPGAQLSAGFDVQYGVNPGSAMPPLARQGGVTRAVLTPIPGRGGGHADEGGGDDGAGDPGLFAGQAAAVRLAAGDPNPVFKARIGMAIDLGESGASAAGSRGAAIVLLKSILDDVRAFARNRAGYERGAHRPFGLTRADLEALIPVVEGKTPLLVRVHRASDIRQVLKLAADEKVKVILEGAEEGWLVAGELAKAGAPVLIDAEADLPDAFETLASRLDNAARLQAAGATIAILGSRDFTNLRQARLNAGTAVANGLPYGAALAGLTINPARIWGFADKAGSLEPGKDADLVIWSGDPLETTSWPTAVFVAGQEQPMTSRGLELRDRYKVRGGAYPPAYN
ncbi:amidohydrolase [Caulobacter sp. CCUG 60055]|uniref:amidohydrolase family protein n=1 Tax=Caulobacter sp. CCUG 60055 TaxID=2100090 RepID=UPI001FA7D84C|nr:amidohydrolase family protein [Caulobacter sp. CCUG 60055]MBQ1540538.1 amidohydrolase family protein [Caulobacteraceae bacterium]MCI3178781.1 amidohydrolase [Caulobacter sp. CCUG 60055]